MNYEQAKRTAALCMDCKLCVNRHQMVWSKRLTDGSSSDPFLMFIGDAPSQADSTVAVPFSDLVLDGLIKEAGLLNYYITNAVKCPTPHGRAPFDTEMSKCFKYLEVQIENYNPDGIILLGKASNDLLWPQDNYGALRDIVGMITDTGGRTYMPAYHPRFITRQTKFIRKAMEDEFILNLADMSDYIETQRDKNGNENTEVS